MKYSFIICVAVVLLCSLWSCGKNAVLPHSAPSRDSIEVCDDLGTKEKIFYPPRNIISLAPNITEILFAVSAQNRLAGVTTFCNYPPAAASIQKVSDLQTPNYELISALHPDIIFMSFSGNIRQAYDKFRALGLAPFLVRSESVDSIFSAIRKIGHAVGRDSTANRVADSLRAITDSIRALASKTQPVTAMIVVDVNPLIVVGSGFINDELAIAGGKNIAEGLGAAYPQLNREFPLEKKPRFILISGDIPETTDAILKIFPEWKQLMKNGTVVKRFNADAVSRPGPRITEGIETLYNELHPH
ncbi:MAG TPA: helical backbone metal receptor [Candidatus Kapabacteria bacterium]|nr:helical backbone metal receptor [Candidatus Kapabacteria bacterium]